MKLFRLLLSPDDSEGTTPDDNKPAPVKAPPVAASIVIDGTKTERELELEKKLKLREIEAAELADQNRSLKEALETKPQPKPAVKSKSKWFLCEED